jgi:predicted TPR repeat methyltransferase
MFNPQHAEAYNNMGNLLEMQGRAQESGPYYYKAITLMPPHMVAKKTLGAAYSALGEMEKAAAVYRQWLAEDPNNPEVRHLLAACTLENVPTRAEDAYVEYTFDAMAKNFDEHLGSLDYRAPQLMADAVQREYGAANKKLTILDAGCGTGLCGPLIATYAERLIGVDLSAGMLEKAKLRGVYDALVKAELTEYLHSQENAFDIIISSDTLNYFGVLNDVFKASRRALRQDGHLFFTVEVAGENAGSESESGYRINSHGRYSHNEDYLRRALNEAGFTIIALETATLRSESCNPVLGFIVTCRANGAAALT